MMQPAGEHAVSPRPRILNLEPQGYSNDARALLAALGEVIDGPLSRQALPRPQSALMFSRSTLL